MVLMRNERKNRFTKSLSTTEQGASARYLDRGHRVCARRDSGGELLGGCSSRHRFHGLRHKLSHREHAVKPSPNSLEETAFPCIPLDVIREAGIVIAWSRTTVVTSASRHGTCGHYPQRSHDQKLTNESFRSHRGISFGSTSMHAAFRPNHHAVSAS